MQVVKIGIGRSRLGKRDIAENGKRVDPYGPPMIRGKNYSSILSAKGSPGGRVEGKPSGP
jgi:hypothetical protein